MESCERPSSTSFLIHDRCNHFKVKNFASNKFNCKSKPFYLLQIFTTNLKSKSKLGLTIDFVEFCPTGQNFVLSGSRAVEVWNIDKAGVIKTIPCESKPTALCWLDQNNLLIGLNDGKLVWSHLDREEVRQSY